MNRDSSNLEALKEDREGKADNKIKVEGNREDRRDRTKEDRIKVTKDSKEDKADKDRTEEVNSRIKATGDPKAVAQIKAHKIEDIAKSSVKECMRSLKTVRETSKDNSSKRVENLPFLFTFSTEKRLTIANFLLPTELKQKYGRTTSIQSRAGRR